MSCIVSIGFVCKYKDFALLLLVEYIFKHIGFLRRYLDINVYENEKRCNYSRKQHNHSLIYLPLSLWATLDT